MAFMDNADRKAWANHQKACLAYTERLRKIREAQRLLDNSKETNARFFREYLTLSSVASILFLTDN